VGKIPHIITSNVKYQTTYPTPQLRDVERILWDCRNVDHVLILDANGINDLIDVEQITSVASSDDQVRGSIVKMRRLPMRHQGRCRHLDPNSPACKTP
jgi:hypothetical protein